MKQLATMNDAGLAQHVERLKRDVEDFCGRTARVASTLKCEGRDHGSDPLYQRLSSIRDFLRQQLAQAEQEVTHRAHESAKRRPATSLGAAFLELSSPWRRIRAAAAATK
jgi:hypothetical protein